MTIAKFNERELLALGLDRQAVAALRHVLQQVGTEVGGQTLPAVRQAVLILPEIVARTAILDLRAALTADKVTGGAVDVQILSLEVNRPLTAGVTLSGRVIGETSNGNVPGTLNLWLSVGGVKVLTHSFTTPDVPGAGKGFAADFTLTVRAPGSAVAGGVLSLAYNAPTVLPSASVPFSMPTSGATFALGMNWTAADPDNIATVKVAFLSMDKL